MLRQVSTKMREEIYSSSGKKVTSFIVVDKVVSLIVEGKP